MSPDFGEKVSLLLIDKGIITALVAVAGFALNRALERFKADLGLKTTRRNLLLQSQIQFRERQLAEFYGPIYALLKRIRPLDDLRTNRRVDDVDASVVAAIRVANERIVEIILTKIHLIDGGSIPESYTRFLTHAAIWHAFWDNPNRDWEQFENLHEAHYDEQFEHEVAKTTEALKRRLHELYQEHDVRGPTDIAPPKPGA